jgi:hypothetical protein
MMTDLSIVQPTKGRFLQVPRIGTSTLCAIRGMSGLLGLIGILTLASSCLFFWHFHDFYTPDSSTYIVPAANILAGHGFVNSEAYPETERTPGYSLFLLPFLWMHLDLKYAIIVQHLLRLLIVLGTTVFALRVTGSHRAALFTGILLCLDLPLLESANSVLTEILFAVTLAAILLLLWMDSRHIAKPGIICFTAGLLAGASVLIRPVNILFVLPATVYLLVARRGFKLRAALSFCLAFVILPLTWAIRNYQETDYFKVATISGKYMLLYSAAGALAIDDPGGLNANLEKRQTQLRTLACSGIQSLYGEDCSQVKIPRRAAYYSSLGSKIVLAHPLAFTKLALRGDAEMLLGGGLDRLKKMTGVSQRVGMILILAYTIPIFCLAILGLWVVWNHDKQLFALIFLVILYFLVISGGAQSDSRFRVPIIPLYALAAAIGLDAGLKSLFSKNEATHSLPTDTSQIRSGPGLRGYR